MIVVVADQCGQDPYLPYDYRPYPLEYINPGNLSVTDFKYSGWTQFMSCLVDGMPGNPTIKQIPKYFPDPLHSGQACVYIIQEPLTETSTMSYQGNEYTMDMMVHRIRLKYPDMDYIIVVGDQQTYDRIVRLKCADPPGYKWLVPMCGEMHVMAHDCNSTWKLWWSPMMQDLVEHCDMGTSTHRKGLLEDWAVKEWNQYDSFVTCVTVAALEWLRELKKMPLDTLMDPVKLQAECVHNATCSRIVDFAFNFGVPYLKARNILRQTSSRENRLEMLAFYNMLAHKCRVTGKTNYDILSVWSIATYLWLAPHVQNVVDHRATLNWRNHAGRCMPVDQIQEKINSGAKKILDHIVSADRVRSEVPKLNYLLPIETAFLFNMVGQSCDYSKYLGKVSTRGTIDAIKQRFNGVAASTFEGFKRANAKNNLNRRSTVNAPAGSIPSNVVLVGSLHWKKWAIKTIEKLTF